MKSFFKEQLEERDRFFKAQLAERDKRIDALKRELDDARAYINHLASIPEFKDPPFISFSKWRADR
nr:MAG TPA: coiled-coil domain-containing protein [Caudoviricetes sp.]